MKKILIVDDNDSNITILLEILGDDYDISVALTGEDALEALEEEVPHLVLLDIVMEGMSGIEVCEIMRENRRTKKVPILFVTATNDAFKSITDRIGGNDLLGKPFKPDILKEKIKALI
jgi:putative two-component system response regulator